MMGRTKWLALTSAALIILTPAAQAQQANPAYNWSGFYVGLNAGGAWGRAEATTNVTSGSYFAASSAALVAAAGTGSFSGDGFTGGVQAGYNWQSGNFVYGVEADFGAFNINGSRTGTGTYAAVPFTITNTADTDWLFTARGRFGWLFSNVLVYATGGLAVTDLTLSNSYSDNGLFQGRGNWGVSKTKAGWTIGGGFEWALGGNWTIKTEYLYLNFASVNAAGNIVDTGGGGYIESTSTKTDLTAHVARAGVNFKF